MPEAHSNIYYQINFTTIMKTILLAVFITISSILSSSAQIARCKGKYLGNIIAYSTPSNYSDLWNQVTSENGSKWGSCDRGSGNYNFGNSDLAYNWARNNNGLFKFHALVWGAQAPSYLANSSATQIETAIRNWFQAVENHYAPMGGLEMIDVLNEPVNTPINREVSNLKAALTQGYRSESANQGDLDNPYGWAIWPFQLARKHFPNSILLINEFNIEHNWNNCRAEYIRMINAIKAAPNLTDGQHNIIDGVGLQAHGIETLSASAWDGCLDEIWDRTNLPIHISELDVQADPNEELQRSQLAHFISSAWEHPHVAGITLWGYIQGSTWRSGNGVSGPGGTDTGIQYGDLTDRPAMTWIKGYFASLPSLPCCPDPAPFGDCNSPTVSFVSPTETSFIAPATVPFEVEAIDDGSITNINFYLNGDETTFHEEWEAPYVFDYVFETAGTYNVRAVAYDNEGNTGSDMITITVNIPQGPFGETASSIPGTIQFEDFDVGGNGFAYYDTDAGTNVDPAPNYRTDEDVDIEVCEDAGGGYNLGWTAAGEWTEYTVNVEVAGTYDIEIRVACDGDDRTIDLSVDGTSLAGDIAIPNTGDWQAWETIVIPSVDLQAGEQVLRLTIGATNYVNLNYMTFIPAYEPIFIELTEGWNLIGYPKTDSASLEDALSSIWGNVEVVKDLDGFYNKSNPDFLNSLSTLEWGNGYFIYVNANCQLDWNAQ